MAKNNEFKQLILGILITLGLHITAYTILFIMGFIAAFVIKNNSYIILSIWYFGSITFFLWQFLYIIPLLLWLKKREKFAMIKGVIIITAIAVLMSGTCAILLWPK